MDKWREFRRFLIARFIIVIVLICGFETLNMTFINRIFVPAYSDWFLKGVELKTLGIIPILMLITMLLGRLLLCLPTNLLPSLIGMGISFSSLNKDLNQKIERILLKNSDVYHLRDLTPSQMFFLVGLLLILLLLVLIPCLAGGIYYVSVVLKEVGKIQEEEKQIKEEYEAKRSQLLADIAHDLKTPITTIHGYSMALADGMVEEEKQEEYLRAIENKSKRLSEMIYLLFDYVKIDTQGFTLKKEKTDLAELLRECVSGLYADVEEKNMELEVGIPDEKIQVELDQVQFMRVIQNLITNGIKHNEEGTRIGIFLEEKEDHLLVSVSDNGGKIPEEQIEYLFDPFVMGDESRNSKGGSGLGLSIAKKILSMHGYKLRFIQNRKVVNGQEYVKTFQIEI